MHFSFQHLAHAVTRDAGHCAALVLASLPVILAFGTVAGAEERTGEQIFNQSCIACHGETGQGTENYPEPLVGDRSVVELAKIIDETMPEGEPESLSAEDSAKVAAYIHEAFYSPVAQARHKPATLAFSRLTARQYENAVADVLGSFREPAKWDGERGLTGEYFKSRRFRRDKAVIERRDPVVSFDFDDGSPDKEKIEPKEYAARWEGSVLAPETGDYEFIIDTENGARLWINGTRDPLIDAWVRSGDRAEYRESIRLLGGRAYPLRLEMFKSEKDKTAAIQLKWKPPHQSDELLPERNLSPHKAPPVLVVETPFPPDDRSEGYERRAAVSKEWLQATTFAAIEAADKITLQLDELTGSKGGDGERDKKLREFCAKFAERAFRRPLTDEQRRVVVDQQFEGAPSPEFAVKRVVLLVLKSPRFLYRESLADGFDAYDVASWLSFGLWDSIPDQPLLDAAAKGELQTREQIAAQAERMVADLRARGKVRAFLHEWLGLQRLHDISKDPALFPGFDPAIVSDLRTSLDLFLDEVVWSDTSDFRQLLLSDSVPLNGRLAKFYGVSLPEDAPFQRVPFEPQERAGVLTHPFLLAGNAYTATSSPIHRGVFLARGVLGRGLKAPPEAFTPLPPDLHPGLTTRERVELQTSAANCRSCHGMINPLGFSLERFDAVGRSRSLDREKPVDAKGSYITRTGEQVTFTGARELANFLAASPEVHEAFVESMFRYMIKQPIQAFGPEQAAQLRQSFTDNAFNVRRLLVDELTTSALAARDLATKAQSQQVSATP